MQAEWPVASREEESAAQKLIPLTERLKLAMSLKTNAYLLGSFLRSPEPILVGAPHFGSLSLQDLSLADHFHPADDSIINFVYLTTTWERPLSTLVTPSVWALSGDTRLPEVAGREDFTVRGDYVTLPVFAVQHLNEDFQVVISRIHSFFSLCGFCTSPWPRSTHDPAPSLLGIRW
jgi:hypothetical protein